MEKGYGLTPDYDNSPNANPYQECAHPINREIKYDDYQEMALNNWEYKNPY